MGFDRLFHLAVGRKRLKMRTGSLSGKILEKEMAKSHTMFAKLGAYHQARCLAHIGFDASDKGVQQVISGSLCAETE